MKTLAKLTCIVAIVFLGACASPTPTHHVTLHDGEPRPPRSSATPSVAVVSANVPELIDRPQLVFRTDGHQMAFSEQYRWADPLRREITRAIASDLGELLDSSRVEALPAEVGSYDVDFKLMLDFQQLDAIVGEGADVDVFWCLKHRGGRTFIGHSSFRQPVVHTANDYAALIAAQRQALRRVTAEIAMKIAVFQEG